MGTLVDTLTEQFRRHWDTVLSACDVVPQDHWKSGDIDYLIPVRQIYHIVFSADCYVNDVTYEEYKPHRRYKIDWEGGALDELPDQDHMKSEADFQRDKLNTWLAGKGDSGLLAQEECYPWTGSTRLDRMLYLLRHGQWHIGELNSELRRRGLQRAKWY
jgi:hypothetical protein